MTQNIFTVDLEDWYHANYHGGPSIQSQSKVVEPTNRLLNLLASTNSKATFFVLGQTAEMHPKLIKQIFDYGHEIASHGYDHNLVYSQTENEFEKDLIKSKNIIQSITSQPPIGYRAPSWSVNTITTPWYWPLLKKNGFKYSSSLFPYKTFLYGQNDIPRFTHLRQEIIEIPPTTVRILSKNIPFSGGFYLRTIPSPLISLFSLMVNKLDNQPVIYYIHPREIDPHQPILNNLNFKEKFIHYNNIKSTFQKLNKILSKRPTASFANWIKLYIDTLHIT